MRERIDIVGVPIDNFGYKEVLERIDDFIKNDRRVYIVTANPEMVLDASDNEKFFEVLNGAAITTPDGTGILWAASYLNKPFPKYSIFQFLQPYQTLFSGILFPKSIRTVLKERVTGTDLLERVIQEAQNKSWRIFLLGASPGVAKKMAQKFSKIYPNVTFVGCHAGTPDSKDEEDICQLINNARPDILFVAYGSPQQEFWIHRNLFKLDAVKVAIGVGGAFDFYSGKVRRAPKLLQRVGLEWLWRLGAEPKRIGRIWNATVRFTRLVAREKKKRHSAQ